VASSSRHCASAAATQGSASTQVTTGQKETHPAPEVTILAERFGNHHRRLAADFICGRHVLEHIADPRNFLFNVHAATVGEGSPIFFEVPNALYTLQDGGIWDIIYEHRSYFTPSSLARLFEDRLQISRGGGKPSAGSSLPSTPSPAKQTRTPRGCGERTRAAGRIVRAHLSTKTWQVWSDRLVRYSRENRKVVVWGARAKATTFLNLLPSTAIDYVVDVNPRKQGRYIAGTGQQIVPPRFLLDYRPEKIICMNPNYVGEISSQLRRLRLLMSA
jgi:hypothetical protein